MDYSSHSHFACVSLHALDEALEINARSSPADQLCSADKPSNGVAGCRGLPQASYAEHSCGCFERQEPAPVGGNA